jgi:hypothetical protein
MGPRPPAQLKPEANGGYRLTKRLTVARVEDMDGVPSTWDVPRDRVAYRLNKNLVPADSANTSKRPTLDACIRQEVCLSLHDLTTASSDPDRWLWDQDSWSGSTGHVDGDVYVYGPDGSVDIAVWSRRVDLLCNGIKACKHFDKKLYQGYER